MILLTGGSACGKSSFAESLCLKIPGKKYYIAAMKPCGEEGAAKVKRHRSLRRGKGFKTIERYTDLAGLRLPSSRKMAEMAQDKAQPQKQSSQQPVALLECICNLTANEMFGEDGSIRDPYEAVTDGVFSLALQCWTLIVITNDVGSEDLTALSGETKAYVDAMGRINAALARQADTICELVCGIPIVLKGELP